ncbi:MAG: HAD-IA family hydrolase [Patescibacteria group bacterium]
MNKKPKWVIFDVGQVLYDYQGFLSHAATHLNIESVLLKSELDEIVEKSMKGEMTFEEVWEQVLKAHGKESELEKILEIHWDSKKFVADTKHLIKQLHNKGYSIALFTNNWPNATERILKNVDEDLSVIKHMFESSVEKLKKPDMKFYELVEKRTGAKGNEIFFIDDKDVNLTTAEILGWQTFLYKLGQDGGKTSNDKIRKQLL